MVKDMVMYCFIMSIVLVLRLAYNNVLLAYLVLVLNMKMLLFNVLVSYILLCNINLALYKTQILLLSQ